MISPIDIIGTVLIGTPTVFFIYKLYKKDKEYRLQDPSAATPSSKPSRPPLTDAEREAMRQAEEAFDWITHNSILEGTYAGPLPEHDGFYWSDLYPDLYHTKMAGINFRRGIKDLAGVYFDATLEPDLCNPYDSNAIKIVAFDGRHVGFIPADETESVRNFLSNQFPASCRAHIDEDEDIDPDTGRTRTYLYGTINIHHRHPNVSPQNS